MIEFLLGLIAGTIGGVYVIARQDNTELDELRAREKVHLDAIRNARRIARSNRLNVLAAYLDQFLADEAGA